MAVAVGSAAQPGPVLLKKCLLVLPHPGLFWPLTPLWDTQVSPLSCSPPRHPESQPSRSLTVTFSAQMPGKSFSQRATNILGLALYHLFSWEVFSPQRMPLTVFNSPGFSGAFLFFRFDNFGNPSFWIDYALTFVTLWCQKNSDSTLQVL